MASNGNSDWRARLEEVAEESGYYEPLGSAHEVLFHDDGPVLLVTFEARAEIESDPENPLPRGHRIARDKGWSSLSLICDRDSWFRDPAVYAYFDRLVDEAFFEDFDRVVFYGAGPRGYAAAAFSVAAPGATVIALAPQATLDPARAGWDDRFTEMRRTSFTDRYGYAPEMLDGVEAGFILFDPFERLDAMHAALFARPGVTLLPCRLLGPALEMTLRDMGALDEILIAAGEDRFGPSMLWPLLRARRNLRRYLFDLAARLQKAERPYLEALLCRNVADRLGGPRFRARFQALEAELAQDGISLPGPNQEAGAA